MDGTSEALKTFAEQTKLLVSLASGFLLAPAAAASFFTSSAAHSTVHISLRVFISAEAMLILSVILGYFVLGSIAGSQHEGHFNVYRRATRILSLLQLVLYVGGLCQFVMLISKLIT